MKFRGFLKKGSIKRRSNELAISDPGSDDSWDLLCKDDNQANLPPGSKPTEVPHTAVTASASATGAQDTAQRDEVIADLSATEIKIANMSVEYQTKTTSAKKKLLPFTSTPFVSHKQIPAFEVSSIISPIDECTNERLPAKEAQNDSGPILVLNRKNAAGVADDAFNQLLSSRKSIKGRSLGELGVRPLKSRINQGDTTRQYGGGALKGRAISSVNPSCKSMEDSWETTDASPTCTTELKKASSSPEKILGRSQESSTGPQSQSGSQDRARTRINEPAEGTNLQDENKAQSTSVEGNHNCNSPRRMCRKSQSVFTKIPDMQTKVDKKELNPILNRNSESLRAGGATDKTRNEPRGKFSQVEETTLLLGGNCPQGGDMVEGIVEDPLPLIDSENSDHISGRSTSSQNKAVRKSIIIDHTKERRQESKKRVSFFEGPDQTNDSKELGARSMELEVQNQKDDKKKSESKKENRNTIRDESVSTNSQSLNNFASVNQVELHTFDQKDRDENKNQTENSQRASTIPSKEVNMVCKSSFAVKIGNSVLTQASSFGFSVDWQKNKSKENDTHVTPASIVDKESGAVKANITESGDEHNNSNSNQAGAVKETIRELHSGSIKTSSIKQNELIEIESSSEEERILLRAQSLKLRENQNNSSRNLKTLKIIDSGQVGLITRQKSSPSKSPVKSLLCEHQPGLNTSPIKIKETLLPSSQCAQNEQPEPLKPDTLNKSDCHDESLSSCDIFISRHPNDCQSNFEDNFQLEIMSSSEDENVPTQKIPKQQSPYKKMKSSAIVINKPQHELSKLRQRIGSRLSSKTKEIRRRRKEKIEEKRKSWGNSSGSDSPSPHPVQKRIRRRDTNIQSANVREIEEIAKCKKKLSLDDIVREKSPKFEKSNAQIVVETSPIMPSTEETSNRNSNIKGKQKNSKSNAAQQKDKPDSNYKVKQKNSKNNATQQKDKPKKIKGLKGEPVTASAVLSQDVLQVHGDGNQAITNDVQLNERNPVSQEKHSSSNKNGNIVTDLPAHEEMASELRCSHRSRKPPSMYWIGNRGHSDVVMRSENEGTSQSHKKPSYNEKKPGSLRTQKRKIDKTSRLDMARTTKRVRQNETRPASSQVNTSHSDPERVLIYDTYNKEVNEIGNVSCIPLEVRTTEFVSGYGLKGEVLSLGAGAKCKDQKSSTYNQVFYVLEGIMNYQCAQDEKILTTGSIFIVPKGQTYNIENLGDSSGKLFVTSCSV